jgi:hypothetical protein
MKLAYWRKRTGPASLIITQLFCGLPGSTRFMRSYSHAGTSTIAARKPFAIRFMRAFDTSSPWQVSRAQLLLIT